jgi:hypothetical protein
MTRALGLTMLVGSLAGLVPALGCGLASEPIPVGPRNVCSEDGDCSAGRCDVDRGLCVAVDPEPLGIYLDVVPPSSFGASDSFGPFALGALAEGGVIALELAPSVRIEGTVRFGERPIAAQVSFRPIGVPLPERAARTITHTFDPLLPEHPAHDFETELVPERSYDVLVEPEGDDRALLPPLHGMLELGATGVSVSLAYAEAELVTILGDVRSSDGTAEPDLEVTAIDAETGETLSSVATTGAEGAFSIHLLSGAPAWLLRLAPTRERQAESVFPTFVVDPRYLTSIDGPGGPRAQVLVPSIDGAVRFAGTVEYPHSLATARPVQGAVVTLRAAEIVDEMTNMVGRLEVVMTTDAAGRFEGLILPGDYEVQAASGASTELGVLLEQRTLVPAAGTTELVGAVLELPARTLLGGVAQAPGAEPFSGVTVRALATGQPLDGLTNPDLARWARSVDSVADARGEFRLELDVGVFDLVVEPAATSGYPWWVETDVGIGGSDRPVSRVAEVRAPVVVDGTLESDAGERIAGAELFAFTRLPSGRLVAIGRATTDADGELRLVLPPEL